MTRDRDDELKDVTAPDADEDALPDMAEKRPGADLTVPDTIAMRQRQDMTVPDRAPDRSERDLTVQDVAVDRGEGELTAKEIVDIADERFPADRTVQDDRSELERALLGIDDRLEGSDTGGYLSSVYDDFNDDRSHADITDPDIAVADLDEDMARDSEPVRRESGVFDRHGREEHLPTSSVPPEDHAEQLVDSPPSSGPPTTSERAPAIDHALLDNARSDLQRGETPLSFNLDIDREEAAAQSPLEGSGEFRRRSGLFSLQVDDSQVEREQDTGAPYDADRAAPEQGIIAVGTEDIDGAVVADIDDTPPDGIKAIDAQTDERQPRWREPVWPQEHGADDEEHWHERLIELEIALTELHGTDQIALLMEIGAVWSEKLGDNESAEMFFERVLALDPAHREAFEHLDEIYEQNRGVDDRIELLLNRTDHADSSEQIEIFHRIATLYEGAGEADKALVVLEAALAVDPSDMATHVELRRFRQRAQLPPPSEETKDPLVLLQNQLQQAEDPEEKIEIYQQLTELYNRKGERQEAIECVQQVLELDASNEAAYGRLEKLIEQTGDLQRLVATLKRHLDMASSSRRIELYRKLGQLFQGPLDDPQRALEAYRNACFLEPRNVQILQCVASLSEQLGEWSAAVNALQSLADLSDSDRRRLAYLSRLARIQSEELGDADAAEQASLELLAVSPGDVGAVERLVSIYRQRRDWGKAVKVLTTAEEHILNPAKRVEALYQAGIIYLEQLNDRRQAIDLMQRTIALDPDHAPAGEVLADYYYDEEQFEELDPILALLLRKIDRTDKEKLCQLYYRLGRTSEALDRAQRAKRYFLDALDIDSAHLQSLRRLATMAYEREEWRDAIEHCERLLTYCGERTGELNEEEVVAVLGQLADSAGRSGALDRAIAAYDDALRIQPKARELIDRLADIKRQKKDFDGVIECKKRLLELSDDDDDDRARLHQEIGDAWLELNRPDEAARVYWEALDVRPKSHTVLHRLLDVYSKARRWSEVVDLCMRLADNEEDQPRRAKYYNTAAIVCRDELDDAEQAIEFFNRALDTDPSELRAFEAIDKICTERRDWKALELAYGKMINRLPTDGQRELKVMLWHNLGEILRSRRRDFSTAAAAFEAAAALDQDNAERQQILAELYLSLGPSHAEKAIALHHQLLRRWPQRFDLYHSLSRLYLEKRDYDAAWCLCAVLAFLQQADAEEARYYSDYGTMLRGGGRMSDDLWRKHVTHPDQDLYISSVFATLAPVMGTMTARPHSDFSLKRKNRRDLSCDKMMISQMFAYITSLLNVQEGDLHLRPDFDAGLLMAHTTEAPSFVVGAHLLEQRDEREVAFIMAKQLTFLRPEYFLRNALTTQTHMQVALLAAFKLCNPGFPLPPGQEAAVDQMVSRLKKDRLHPSQLEHLATCVQQIRPERVDLGKWWLASEQTGERMGLIVCGDPSIAAAMISTECEGSETSAKERIAEMIRFAASEQHFQIRRELGMVINV